MSLTNDQITAQNFSDFYNKISPYLGIAHAGFTPVGALVIMTGNEVPANHLACDGTVYNISAYPELAAYYARSQGACNFYGGDGTTTFAVPDLRGEFIRGTGTNSHTNQGNGANVGVHQDATELAIDAIDSSNGIHILSASNTLNADSEINNTSNKRSLANATADSGGKYATSRPTNTSFLICVAAKNIFNDVGNNYSLEEQEVGTWVGGEKIYQKTINFGQLPNNTTKDVAHGISNIDTVIDVNGFAIDPNGWNWPLPYANTTASGTVTLLANNTYIRVITATDRSNVMTSYVTLRYTKVSS